MHTNSLKGFPIAQLPRKGQPLHSNQKGKKKKKTEMKEGRHLEAARERKRKEEERIKNGKKKGGC